LCRDGGVIHEDLPQAGCPQGDHGDAAGIDRVGLAALTGGEDSGSGGQLRRHVHDRFIIGDQALSHVAADAAASFDGPDPVRVLAAGGEHRFVAVAVGGEPASADSLFPVVDDLDRGGTLVWVHADDDLGHPVSLPRADRCCQRGGHRYFELGIPS
jgi:hypothetical protein